MPLNKTSKSVLFYRGMSDDTEQFLAKSPAVEYTENLREEKTGVYSKRPGSELMTVLLTGPGELPSVVESVGDALVAATADFGFAYRNGTWGQATNAGGIRLRGVEVPAATAPRQGARGFQHIPRSSGYAIAFEERPANATVLQFFTDEGTLEATHRYTGEIGPQLSVAADGRILLYSVADFGANNLRLRRFNEGTGAYLNAVTATGVTISTSGDYTSPIQRRDTPLDPDIDRLGFAGNSRAGSGGDAGGGGWEPRNAMYHVASFGDGRGAMLYQEGPGAGGDIYIRFLDSNGTPLTNELIVAGASGVSLGALTIAAWLDGGERHAAIAYARYVVSGSTYTQNLHVNHYRFQSGSNLIATEFVEVPVALQTTSEMERFYPQATLARDGSNIYLAYTDSLAPDLMWGSVQLSSVPAAPPSTTGIRYTRLDYDTGAADSGYEGIIYGHRLASVGVIQDGEFLVSVQPWGVFSPVRKGTAGDNIRAQHSTNGVVTPQLKPVTTVVGVLKDGNVFEPAASLGGSSSRWSDPTSDETVVILPSLWVGDGAITAINREILTAEDVVYVVEDDNVWDGRHTASQAPSEARGILYRFGKDLTGVTTAQLGNSAAVASALPAWISGSTFSEAGMLGAPEILGLVNRRSVDDQTLAYWTRTQYDNIVNPVPGGADGTRVRRLVLVAGYTDASGQLHRSAPSSPVWFGTVNDVQLSDEMLLWYLPPLGAFGGRDDYFVEVYASDGDGDVPKLAGRAPVLVSDGPNEFVVGFNNINTASVSELGPPPDPDASLRRGYVYPRSTPSLYTETGELTPISWPAFKHIAATSRRLWGISDQYPGSVLYSKLFEENIAPEFTGEFVIPLGEERDLQAVGILDDKAVVFEPRDIHIIYGEGPDNRGRGTDFAVEYLQTGGIGCTQPKSVIEVPTGLIFYDQVRGFHLIDRNRTVQWIGAGVKDLARDITIYDATVLPDEAEARFLVGAQWPQGVADPDYPIYPPIPKRGNELPSEACLSYNYESGIWALYRNFPGFASTVHEGRYVRVSFSDDTWPVFRETPGQYRDPGALADPLNATLLRSHWIDLGGQVQGYQRLWKITCLGRYLSTLDEVSPGVYEAGDLRVRIWYDYEKDYAQEVIFKMQDFDFSPFDSPQRRQERFQFRVEPNRGRCQAIKLEFAEVMSEIPGAQTTLGQGIEIVAADLEIGVGAQESTRLIGQGVRR